MKKKIFFAALILFSVFLNSMILMVSIIILRDKLSTVRDKCLAEHYVIASSLRYAGVGAEGKSCGRKYR